MKIIYSKDYITRRMVRQHKDHLYLFGDNVAQYGNGGMAFQLRNQPNAYGLPTKWMPLDIPKAYFTDQQYEDFMDIIDTAFDNIPQGYQYIVIPIDNNDIISIGTGLADMPNKCPKCYQYFLSKFKWLQQNLKKS